MALQVGHTETPYYFSSFVSDDVSSPSVDIVGLAVEVLQLELEPDQRLNQRDCLLHEQVSSFAGEDLVGLLLDDKYEVSGKRISLNKKKYTYSFPYP